MSSVLWWIDLILLIAGGLIALGWLIAVIARGRDPLRGSPLRPNRLGPVVVWICFTANVLGWSVGPKVADRAMPAGLSEPSQTVYKSIAATSIGSVFAIVICLAASGPTFTGGWRGFGLGRRSVLRDLCAAIPAVIASLSVCNAVAWVTGYLMPILIRNFKPGEHSVITALHDERMPMFMQRLAIFGALILAPNSEELVFRGILQTAVRRLVSPKAGSLRHRWIAIVLVSILFGALHLATPQNVPALIVLGMILGYLYERTGSLMLPIFVHMLFNGKSLLWVTLLPQ